MNVHTQHCTDCDVWFRNIKDRENHLASFKHQRNAGTLPPLVVCDLCAVAIKDMTRHSHTLRHLRQTGKGRATQTIPNSKSVSAVSTLS